MADADAGRADAVIVGAGVIGLAVAFELLRRGRQVLLCERHAPGAGASTVAAGMLAPTSEADIEEPLLIDFALDSLRRYPAFVAAVEAAGGRRCGLRREGTLWVARNRDDEADLEHLLSMQRAKRLRSRRLTAKEIFDREPHLSPRVIGGLLVEDDHQIDPRRLIPVLDEAVRRLGGIVCDGWDVETVQVDGSGAHVLTGRRRSGSRFSVIGNVVVLATGAWTGIAVDPPLPALGIRPVKGQIVRLEGAPLIQHVVRTPEVYLVPRANGELVVGATMEEQGFDRRPTGGAVMDLLRSAWEVLPGIYDLAVRELSVGFRPAARDSLPVIGPTPVAGLFIANGHFRNGILLAPATAYYLAEAIVTGTVPDVLTPFAIDRLTRGPVVGTGRVAAHGEGGIHE